MKREELEALGLSKEQVDKVLNKHHEELDPIQRELDTAKEDLKAVNETIETQKTTIGELKSDLEEFKDADVSGMKTKIANLEADLEKKEAEHTQQLADRDFNDLLKESIAAANGKNAKAITALLDVDKLKASKNQKEDIAADLKALTEAEDSKMLFGEPEPNPVGTDSLIGRVYKSSGNAQEAAMRAAMGLPPVGETE